MLESLVSHTQTKKKEFRTEFSIKHHPPFPCPKFVWHKLNFQNCTSSARQASRATWSLGESTAGNFSQGRSKEL